MCTEKKRLEVTFHGKVQGVFFRANTKKFAKQNGVKGWVSNCPDGTVKAVFEGIGENIDITVEMCVNDQPLANVTHHRAQRGVYTGKYTTFSVKYY